MGESEACRSGLVIDVIGDSQCKPGGHSGHDAGYGDGQDGREEDVGEHAVPLNGHRALVGEHGADDTSDERVARTGGNARVPGGDGPDDGAS